MLPDDDDDDFGAKTVEMPVFATPPPKAPTRHEQLLILLGERAGEAFEVGDGVTIGRSNECEIPLTHGSISRTHARVERRPDGSLRLLDLGSRNGTFVNGIRIESHPLAIGDRIQIGSKVALLLTHEDPLKSILRDRQKMEAIGRLAAGIAHDFNNVSFAALAACEHVIGRMKELGVSDVEMSESLADLRTSLERGADLTRGLATLGRKKSGAAADRVDVAEVCEETARLCQHTFGSRIEVRRRLRRGLSARAHRTELHQILLNLCLNARDAMPDGGRLTIAAERGSGSRLPPYSGPEWVLVTVSDTGVGMSEQVRSRIFEPFFTTKREGHGTGLGLATAFDLVRSMQGSIEVESEVGRGTSFCVWLPGEGLGSSGEYVERPVPPAAVRSTPKTGRVLIVEDQELVQRSLARLLTASGHTVMRAANGREALQRYQSADPRPDIVLLDLDMPVMGGEETLEHLRAIDPGVRVIAISGHWDPDRAEALNRAGVSAYLAKPFEAPELRATIDRLLSQS